MPKLEISPCGFRARIVVAGKTCPPFFATKPRAHQEVQQLRAIGDISHLEANALNEEITREKRLHNTGDELLSRLETIEHDIPEIVRVIVLTEEHEDIEMPFAQA
jgi:hypothetical protein